MLIIVCTQLFFVMYWLSLEYFSLFCCSFVQDMVSQRNKENYLLSMELASSSTSTILALKVGDTHFCNIMYVTLFTFLPPSLPPLHSLPPPTDSN